VHFFVYGQEIVAVSQLETDHLFGTEQIDKLRLFVAALFEQLPDQQSLFTHSLDGFPQVAG